MKKSFLILGVLATFGLIGTSRASAQALMLSFGSSNALNPSLNTAANNPAGIAGGTFNTVSADRTTGLVFSDGSAASNITLDLGLIQQQPANTAAPTAFKASVGSNTAFNQATGTGIYAAGAVASNSLYEGSGSGTGLNIGGLAGGIYTVYVVGVRAPYGTNSLSQVDYAQDIATPSFNSAADMNISGYTQATQANGAAYSPTAFVLGGNYQAFTVTVTPGDSLFVGSINANASTSFLNLVEVVPVPEPSTWVGVAMMGLLGASALRRTLRPRQA